VNETFTGIENLSGSDNDDILSATGVAENVLAGGAGNDLLSGGLGNDVLDGGDGFDTVDFSGIDAPVTLDLDENGNGTATRVVDGVTEVDTLISIEDVILGAGDEVIEGTITGGVGRFNERTFNDLDDGDQFVFNGTPTFSTADIAVDGQSVAVPGSSFTVDGNLDEGNFLAASIDADSTVVEFVDELLGDGLDLIEGQAVSAAEIDGISFGEFVEGAGSTDFTVTLDNSTSGFENSFGVFVFDSATGLASDVQIVAANAQNGGSTTISDVAQGEQVGFFIVQDGASDTFDFAGGTLAELSAASSSEVFQSIDAGLNSDGAEHFLSGSVDGGGALRVGVEDLTGLGDSDFQDVVFTVTRDDADDFSFV